VQEQSTACEASCIALGLKSRNIQFKVDNLLTGASKAVDPFQQNLTGVLVAVTSLVSPESQSSVPLTIFFPYYVFSMSVLAYLHARAVLSIP
jgi:hypothetical protein